jgi:UDP-glucose 4-epimerase
MATVLLTGATGYIGSHTWLALLAAGFDVVGVDNFSNSSPEVLTRLQALSGRTPDFERLDVCDAASVDQLFAARRIDAVVHFAAYKAVGESVQKALAYYANNLGGLMTVCQAMQTHGCNAFVFSSSATVYGRPDSLPIREDSPLMATSPYGSTKLMGENILRDIERSSIERDGAMMPNPLNVAYLRYFNPVGAHESGQIGEDPRGTPNNLMPYVTQVAVGKRAKLSVFGSDYETPDGTGVRDYIHVLDLAEGHVSAVRYLLDTRKSLCVNLGTGRGYSVLELVSAFEKASGRSIAYELVDRRAGDVDACYADPALARQLLGWQASRDLDAMCTDSWRWQKLNPAGYSTIAAS